MHGVESFRWASRSCTPSRLARKLEEIERARNRQARKCVLCWSMRESRIESMTVAAKTKREVGRMNSAIRDLSAYVPKRLGRLDNPQKAIPRLAKDSEAVQEIERAVRSVPTSHWLYRGDGRDLS